ncbi:MAG TPA: DUF2961 domain-containing protein [Phycisphaerae bacterium]|nr:DUF2961 domain-containing protein [Phycisphaerae bacterium]
MPPSAVEGAEGPRQTVDLRPVFANWGLDVRSQGARNTCSVFVVADALEYAVATQRRSAVELSVEFLNWAANQVTGEAVDGSYFSDAWKGFAAYGLCPEEDMPYVPVFAAQRQPGADALQHARALREAGLRLHWIKPWDVTTGLTDVHLREIKHTLRQQWPVCAGLRWPKKEEWQDDVLQMAPPEGVRDGHSVLLVGFRDDPQQPGGGAFIFRNTSKTARDGYMTYEYAAAYMNDAAWIDFDLRSATGAAATDPPATAVRDLLNPLSPAPPGRNRRVSSNQQPDWHSENLDMTWVLPGHSIEIPPLIGPGVITHMWFTSHAGWVSELNAWSLRIYWDGRQEPGVEVPLGDFFAVGQGKPAVVNSIPVQVSGTGALSCYWRMPFEQSAHMVITNDNPDRSTGLYWQIDWTQLDGLPPGTPYFHARYRQEYPAAPGRDYTFAQLEGRGFYVGTVLSVTLAQDGWFGEGDDFFYLDGEEVPSLQGTGSEDYFNDAWGFRPRTSHWFGTPRWQGDRAGDGGVCYRWHLPDPIYFGKSLTAAIEHKGNHEDDTEGFYLERPDFFSSVAFWYQEGEPKPFCQLPPWPQRRMPWEQRHCVRAFRQAQGTGDAKVRVDTSGLFGARPVLLWPNRAADAVLTLPFAVTAEGRYAVRLTAAGGPDYGRYDIEIDGRKVLDADFRSSEPAELDLLLGTHVLATGEHEVSFRAAPAAPDRAGPLAVEMLRLLKLPPEAKREVRTHHEAHFIRLGIGRAVYAYRLAYDRLPDSLQELVESGIMAARYLSDENNVPLRSRREGEFFIVESAASGGWTHRWQGLDARR